MELIEAFRARKSVRAFLPTPVPRPMMEEVLELASRSPSWGNTQPWEVTVIGGKVMEQLKDVLFQVAESVASTEPDIPLFQFAEPYQSRRRDLGYRLYQLLGIERSDKKARSEWDLQGSRFFNAPNGLVFYLNKELGSWSLFDLGMFFQSVMLAALSFGLGTCPLAQGIFYPAVLRGLLNIPEDKTIVCTMAIGYPDWQHPVNKLESPREPVESFTRWCGFNS